MNIIPQASSENQAQIVSRIISTAEQVEKMIDSAIQALLSFNQPLAQTVTKQEKEVNQQSALISSELQHQDAREAAAMLKISKDLEHLAGLAGSIARRIVLVND